MSSIVYQTNKRTGVVYAYRSVSYRDPVTKKPTSRRTYLGRVDPITQNIIKKAEPGKRNRTKITTVIEKPSGESVNSERMEQLENQVRELQTQIKNMATYQRKADNLIKRIHQMTAEIQSDS